MRDAILAAAGLTADPPRAGCQRPPNRSEPLELARPWEAFQVRASLRERASGFLQWNEIEVPDDVLSRPIC